MLEYLILRDRRLTGTLPLMASLAITCDVDASIPLGHAFSRINGSAMINGGKLSTMFILCHGYAGSNPNAQVSMDAGGMGLQLGKEGVLHGNVSMWEVIKNKVETIVVYSCAAANTEAGNEGTSCDGSYLMGALAIHTNAHVYAADRIQWYNTRNYDFGAWEGQLKHFPPSGEPANNVTRPPIELSSVI